MITKQTETDILKFLRATTHYKVIIASGVLQGAEDERTAIEAIRGVGGLVGYSSLNPDFVKRSDIPTPDFLVTTGNGQGAAVYAMMNGVMADLNPDGRNRTLEQAVIGMGRTFTIGVGRWSDPLLRATESSYTVGSGASLVSRLREVVGYIVHLEGK